MRRFVPAAPRRDRRKREQRLRASLSPRLDFPQPPGLPGLFQAHLTKPPSFLAKFAIFDEETPQKLHAEKLWNLFLDRGILPEKAEGRSSGKPGARVSAPF